MVLPSAVAPRERRKLVHAWLIDGMAVASMSMKRAKRCFFMGLMFRGLIACEGSLSVAGKGFLGICKDTNNI